MKLSPLPFFWRLCPGLGSYATLAGVCINVGMTVGWTWLLIRAIPTGTPLAPAGRLLITAIPLLMLEGAINLVLMGLSCEYSVFVRWQRLRIELEADRAKRDEQIAHTILSQLANRAIEEHEAEQRQSGMEA